MSRLESIETVFRTTGYIPVVSSITGPLRSLMGLVQIVAYGIFAIHSFYKGQKELQKSHVVNVEKGLINLIRGLVEFIPLLGNFLCLTYEELWLKEAAHKEVKHSGSCWPFSFGFHRRSVFEDWCDGEDWLNNLPCHK
ncbi:MAG: hypothetical protein WCP39_01940 [Chlamydiota bacterium]